MNDALLTMKLPESRHPFLETMTATRAEGLKPRNNIEVLDQDIKGKIVINAKLFGSASLSVAILNERGASHTLTAWKVSQDGPLGSVYEFWVQNSFMANG